MPSSALHLVRRVVPGVLGQHPAVLPGRVADQPGAALDEVGPVVDEDAQLAHVLVHAVPVQVRSRNGGVGGRGGGLRLVRGPLARR